MLLSAWGGKSHVKGVATEREGVVCVCVCLCLCLCLCARARGVSGMEYLERVLQVGGRGAGLQHGRELRGAGLVARLNGG